MSGVRDELCGEPALRGEAQRLVAEHQKLFTSFYNLV